MHVIHEKCKIWNLHRNTKKLINLRAVWLSPRQEGMSCGSSLREQCWLLSGLILPAGKLRQRAMNLGQVTHVVSGWSCLLKLTPLHPDFLFVCWLFIYLLIFHKTVSFSQHCMFLLTYKYEQRLKGNVSTTTLKRKDLYVVLFSPFCFLLSPVCLIFCNILII